MICQRILRSRLEDSVVKAQLHDHEGFTSPAIEKTADMVWVYT